MTTNRINPIISIDASYVYHMLSVAKCGYDNDYGSQHAHLHPPADLAVLKQREHMLTVKGGEHMGMLYPLLVIFPAAMENAAQRYYGGAQYWFGLHGWDAPADDVVAVSGVMVRNFDIFRESVWSSIKAELSAYAAKVQTAFEQNGLTAKLEGLVGIAPEYEMFHPIFTNSLSGGAEAIDVTDNRHIFGTGRDIASAVRFIAHEYIISLLKQALRGTEAFALPMQHWLRIESLAAYYYSKVFAGEHLFIKNRAFIEFYEGKNGTLAAKELFLAAVQEIKDLPGIDPNS